MSRSAVAEITDIPVLLLHLGSAQWRTLFSPFIKLHFTVWEQEGNCSLFWWAGPAHCSLIPGKAGLGGGIITLWGCTPQKGGRASTNTQRGRIAQRCRDSSPRHDFISSNKTATLSPEDKSLSVLKCPKLIVLQNKQTTLDTQMMSSQSPLQEIETTRNSVFYTKKQTQSLWHSALKC